MAQSQEGTNWFEKHVLSGLADLKAGQQHMLDTALRLHNSNKDKIEDLAHIHTEHAADDVKEFAFLKREIALLKPVRFLVYSAVGIILATVFGALVGLVVTKGGGH